MKDEPISISVFDCICKPRVTCSCGHASHYKCEFPLRGKAQGRTCGRALCATCAVTMPKGALHCATHARMVNLEARR